MDYQAEIDRLRDLQDKEQAELRKRKWAEWRDLASEPENWVWESAGPEIVAADPFTRYAGRPCVHLTKRLRPDALADWKQGGTGGLSDPGQHVFMDGAPLGCRFILTDEGILTHEGGGYIILNTPRLCSPQEWEAICSGRPPAKFRK